MQTNQTKAVQDIFQGLMDAWNHRNAREMADLFSENGEMIGFDGSQVIGREEINSHLKPIFEAHPTPPYISKVKRVRFLDNDVAIIRAIAGMIPPDETEINPQFNTHHTLIAVKEAGDWKIELFQNTPAQFHGRPELVEAMTAELKSVSEGDLNG